MRLPVRLILSGAVLVVSASCFGDRPLAPAGPPVIGGNPALRSLVVAQTVDLVIPASGGQLNILDVYSLDFPAGAVCDPDAADTQAGYANAAWDSDCTPANRDIAIRATVKWVNSRLYVDFQPALRFVPSKTVRLTTSAFASTVQYLDAQGMTSGSSIGYSTAIEGTSVADALSDSSLRTVIVGNTGSIFRRIKHFSGYVIVYDGQYIPCDPAEGNPLCVWVESEG